MGVGKESRNMDVKKANLYPKIFCLFWWGEWDLIDPLSGFIAFWGLGRKISCDFVYGSSGETFYMTGSKRKSAPGTQTMIKS